MTKRVLPVFLLLACGGDKEGPVDDLTSDTSTAVISPTADTVATGHTATPTAHTGRTGVTAATTTTADTGSLTAVTGVTGATADTAGGLVAVPGATCAREDLVGTVEIYGFGASLTVGGAVYDGPDPQVGPATLDNGECAHHTIDTGACGMCATGLLCGAAGQCVAPREPVPGTFELSSGGSSQTVDGAKGYFYDAVTVGGPTDQFSGVLSFSGIEVVVPAMGYASGELGTPVVRIDSDFFSPGPLQASWSAPLDGGMVSSLIPINHHVQHPTFTWCEVEASTEGFMAPEAMIDPLAVVTGLEFQGLAHHQVAAAETPMGCVEFRYGPQLFVSTTY